MTQTLIQAAARRLCGSSPSPLIVAAVFLNCCGLARAGKFNEVLSIGDAAPAFSDLAGTDDRRYALADFAEARAVVVLFTSNACPISKGYDERVVALAAEFSPAEAQFVAINASRPDAESLQHMRERAEASGYEFPYVEEPSQETAEAFGVLRTPTVFVLDRERRVAYMGAIDDSPRQPKKVKRDYLRAALRALVAGEVPAAQETKPQGCDVEY